MSGQILVVDPIAINRIVLRSRVAVSCHRVFQACGPKDTFEQIVSQKPDLILLGPGLDGDAACELTADLRGGTISKGIPVIVLTSLRDPALMRRALRAGAEDALDPGVQSAFLLARIRRLLRQRDALEELAARSLTDRQLGLSESAKTFERAGRIALVTTTDIAGRAWETALQPLTPHMILRANHHETLSALPDADNIDMYIVQENPDKPDESLRFLAELRSTRDKRTAAVIMVAANSVMHLPDGENRLAMTLDIGANDILRNGFDAEELALRVTAHMQRKREDDRLRNQVSDELRIAVRDPLTGLFNRRYAQPHLTRIAGRAMESGKSFAVLMIDIDRFKSVNDTYGHGVGDQVLVEVAARLRDNIRKQDLLARMGGEEFMIAMPDTHLDRAQMVADRICRIVRERPVQIDTSTPPIEVTVSIGLAMANNLKQSKVGYAPMDQSASNDLVRDITDRADRALYSAKAKGRNTFTVGRSAA